MLLAGRAAIQTLAGRDDEVLQPEADRHRHRVSVVTAWAVIVYWTLTLPFVWWAPWTQIPWFLTGLVGNLVGRIYQGGGWKRLHIRTS